MVDALRARGLLERTLVSTQYMRSLIVLRELEPALRLGWSVPRVRRDYTLSWPHRLPAYAALLYMRRRLPGKARAHLEAGRCDAVMAHWRLVTPALLDVVRETGGELYVWTVDDARRIRRARGDGRHRRDHERPAAVRSAHRAGRRGVARGIGARRRAVAGLGHLAVAADDPAVAPSSGSARRRGT